MLNACIFVVVAGCYGWLLLVAVAGQLSASLTLGKYIGLGLGIIISI